MTENERKAIDALQDMIAEGQSNGDVIVARDDEEELNTAIQAIEEIQQYRAIGTVEEFKVLKEKSVAKKPLPKGTHKGIDNFYCPNCNHPLTNRHEQCELPYCEICGQKLDWSE